MRADYMSSVRIYNEYQKDLYDIMLDVVLEADTQNNTKGDETPSSPNKDKGDAGKREALNVKFNNVKIKIRSIIAKISAIIDTLSKKLSNRIRLGLETDKGFKELLYRNKSMVKPLDNVIVVSYKYHDDILERSVERVMKDIFDALVSLKDINNARPKSGRIGEIVNAPRGQMISQIVKPYAQDDAINTIPKFVKLMIDKYRGNKAELKYDKSQLGALEKFSLSSGELVNKCNYYLKQIKSAYTGFRQFQNQVVRASNDEKLMTYIMEAASKASELFNAYSLLINMYYEAKLEQILNTRIIVKKFYQI